MSTHRSATRSAARYGVVAASAVTAVAVAVALALSVAPDGDRAAEFERSAPPSAQVVPTPGPSGPAPTPRPAVPPATSPSPTAPAVGTVGSGDFRTAPGRSRIGDGARVVEYRVQVETSLDVDPARLATTVESTLADRRGWTSTGRYTFSRRARGALRVRLVTPGTADRLCAPLRTEGRLSCRNGNLVVINARRWLNGIEAYRDLGAYRSYVINHEVGHAIGQPHESCPRTGEPAPVMQQQTISMEGCTPNPWVRPDPGSGEDEP